MSAALMDQVDLPDYETIAAVLNGVAYYTYAIGRPRPGILPLEQAIRGIDPRCSVRAVGCGEMVALVSDVSLAEFDLDTLGERLQSRPWLEMLAIGHQRVMTALFDSYTLLPLKICTLYTDEERIYDLLAANRTLFAATLDRLEGTSEWGVKFYCDHTVLAAWSEQGAPQLQQLAAMTAAASPGARYMLEKRLKRAAEQLADEMARSETQAVATRLTEVTRAAQQNQPQPTAVHGHGDEMMLNGTYLLGDEELPAFMAVLDDLREHYEARGFSLELTGPWPAYSFSAGDEEA
jgi:hypothetical protein